MLTPFIAFFTIIVVALLVVQLGANALTLTGMSQSVARFQACSAFFGVGFTTREAEMVVDHPVRRRIILHLIIAGNIGITSALATLVVTVMNDDKSGLPPVFATLIVVIAGIGQAVSEEIKPTHIKLHGLLFKRKVTGFDTQWWGISIPCGDVAFGAFINDWR